MTLTITLFQQSSVIWLIGAEIQEKRPVRRQYITMLTTGTIKLLCHLLFLAWKQGPFIPRRLNVHLCSRRGSWASNVRVEPQTVAGEAITELLLLINALRRSHHRHIVQFEENRISFLLYFFFCCLWFWLRPLWPHLNAAAASTSSIRGNPVPQFPCVLIYRDVDSIWLHTNCRTI